MIVGESLVSFKHLFYLESLFPVFNCAKNLRFDFKGVVKCKDLVFSLKFLKLDLNYQYSLLSCISGVDFLDKIYRFLISYELLSLSFNSRFRVKMFIQEHTLAKTSVDFFINANWWEREIWDLYGIYFEFNMDLRRLLCDYGFEGHPLRKDFPLAGFREVHYYYNFKETISDINQIVQEPRLFNYRSPWVRIYNHV